MTTSSISQRFGKGTKGTGWYSFDYNGVHFVGLVNVANAKSGSMAGLGQLGREQLAMARARIWRAYPAARPSWCSLTSRCGPSTRSGAGARKMPSRRWRCSSALARSPSSTATSIRSCKRSKGRFVFHTARSTAFPQSEPGKGTPGPIRDLPAARLRSVLGITRVGYATNHGSLAVTDQTLE